MRLLIGQDLLRLIEPVRFLLLLLLGGLRYIDIALTALRDLRDSAASHSLTSAVEVVQVHI
jgi:hypothetical protein